MTLPKFTAGQVGRLEFSHLNDAFGFIDLERNEQPPGIETRTGKLPLVLAQTTGYDATTRRYSWKEIVIDENGVAQILEGGRTSVLDSDNYAFPAYDPGSSLLGSGSVVTLIPKRSLEGKPIYLISTVSGNPFTMIIIQGVQQELIPGRMWMYKARRAYFDFVAPIMWRATGEEIYALNGCENAVDVVPTSIGVGTSLPVSGSATRRIIKNGTVVLAMSSGNTFYFSIPNGYQYGCPP